jgi:hypothetical protein
MPSARFCAGSVGQSPCDAMQHCTPSRKEPCYKHFRREGAPRKPVRSGRDATQPCDTTWCALLRRITCPAMQHPHQGEPTTGAARGSLPSGIIAVPARLAGRPATLRWVCLPTTEKEPGRAPVLVDPVASPGCSSHFPPWSSGSVAPAVAPKRPSADRAIPSDAACTSGVQRGHTPKPPAQGDFFAKSALPQYRSQILELNPTDIP